MERRKAVIAAATASLTLLAGAAVISLNTSLVGASGDDGVGQVSPVDPATTPSTVYVDEPAAGPTTPPSPSRSRATTKTSSSARRPTASRTTATAATAPTRTTTTSTKARTMTTDRPPGHAARAGEADDCREPLEQLRPDERGSGRQRRREQGQPAAPRPSARPRRGGRPRPCRRRQRGRSARPGGGHGQPFTVSHAGQPVRRPSARRGGAPAQRVGGASRRRAGAGCRRARTRRPYRQPGELSHDCHPQSAQPRTPAAPASHGQ